MNAGIGLSLHRIVSGGSHVFHRKHSVTELVALLLDCQEGLCAMKQIHQKDHTEEIMQMKFIFRGFIICIYPEF
jgi:hypothetical protein